MDTFHIPKNDEAAVWIYVGIIRQNNKIKDNNQKGILQYETTTKSVYK